MSFVIRLMIRGSPKYFSLLFLGLICKVLQISVCHGFGVFFEKLFFDLFKHILSHASFTNNCKVV